VSHLQVVTQGAHDLLNLLGQLTGGGQHQSLQEKGYKGNMNKMMISSQLNEWLHDATSLAVHHCLLTADVRLADIYSQLQCVVLPWAQHDPVRCCAPNTVLFPGALPCWAPSAFWSAAALLLLYVQHIPYASCTAVAAQQKHLQMRPAKSPRCMVPAVHPVHLYSWLHCHCCATSNPAASSSILLALPAAQPHKG
jgi:hypothetical protein